MSNQTSSPKLITDIPLSVLDLAPIVHGSNAAESFQNSLELAQHTERLHYHRYWLAEHHNMPGIASAATSVLIGYIASGTSKIRVGSGGIMLPNHAPLVIAEQFGTLETLYPGRIDLGLGRAPGSDQLTSRALRRDSLRGGEDFPVMLQELRSYLDLADLYPDKQVTAVPGDGLQIPIWLLGSSGYSAQLAGQLGLPFAFAAHFSPDYTVQAFDLYRSSFRPSETLTEPYAMVCINAIAADTDEHARWLSTSGQQMFLNMIRGKTRGLLQPPVEDMDALWNDFERMTVERQLSRSIAGSPETVKSKLQALLDETGVNEIMINCQVYDHKERLRSYELISQIVRS